MEQRKMRLGGDKTKNVDRRENRRSRLLTIILFLLFFTGLGLVLYPFVSNAWNQRHQTRMIADYQQAVADMDQTKYEEMREAAQQYNAKIAARPFSLTLSEEEKKEYNSLLNVTGTGIMGYVEIPKISCMLPVYHGTDEGALRIAIGHLEGTSLPVGGKSTHSVLSGHRGMPNAKLFSQLDKLVVGDTFRLHVLDQVLTYEVDQIQIVLPDDISSLAVTNGEDFCTLVTCTPYGVNTHRLLVRGHRVTTETDETAHIPADATQIPQVTVALALGIVFFLLFILIAGLVRRRLPMNPEDIYKFPEEKQDKDPFGIK